MVKKDLVKAMADRMETTQKNAALALDALLEVVTEELSAQGKVQIVGFGTFEVATRAAREGRNPLTGEVIDIPETKYPKFKAGKLLKEAVK